MYKRHIERQLRDALGDTPVVFLAGGRQTGKTTLVRSLGLRGGHYLTLDDASTLATALRDPQGLLAGLDGPVVIDEVQKAPSLFPAIKWQVDRQRRPGRYLLTGSARVMVLPKASESLAGRMQTLALAPLSQGEIAGKAEGFIGRIFADKAWPAAPALGKAGLAQLLVRGGYPDAVARPAQRREAWLDAYVDALLLRDIRDLSAIEGLGQAPRLLNLLAARSGGLLNVSEVARSAALPNTTLQRYMALFEAVFLLHRIPAWSANLGKRMVKSPKLLLGDSGVMARLLRIDAERLGQEPNLSGRLLETFVGGELLKQAAWHRDRPALLHYRSAAGREVDFVLEAGAGKVAGVEVKHAASVSSADLVGLQSLAQDAGARFAGGVILYNGDQALPVGPRIWALPLASLWASA